MRAPENEYNFLDEEASKPPIEVIEEEIVPVKAAFKLRTPDELSNLLRKYATKAGMPAAKALLLKFKARNATAITDADQEAFVKTCEAVL